MTLWVALAVLCALSGGVGYWAARQRGIQQRQQDLADAWEEFYGPTTLSKTRRYGE